LGEGKSISIGYNGVTLDIGGEMGTSPTKAGGGGQLNKKWGGEKVSLDLKLSGKGVYQGESTTQTGRRNMSWKSTKGTCGKFTKREWSVGRGEGGISHINGRKKSAIKRAATKPTMSVDKISTPKRRSPQKVPTPGQNRRGCLRALISSDL